MVGADGVHSTVREIMWDKANTAKPVMITVDEKRGELLNWLAAYMKYGR